MPVSKEYMSTGITRAILTSTPMEIRTPIDGTGIHYSIH